ncbi:uncharacterized protein LOC124201780 isoform X2 [Daphnia pulex]|uniref:uncharacterized protein LOC124201780 isoform X2 n=1 Tax=Daphnia pulex TaxID=6669 RepID=UPI001EE019C6|nr:uncharacterized protein LOC124201780 isoform X2 [Daphnia pulex]
MIVQIFYLALIFLLKMSSSSVILCNNDSDCGNEYYCLSGFCEECFPCSEKFNRQPPSNNNETICVKTEEHCRNRTCLPGYEADELANGQNFSTKCYRAEKVVSSDLPTWVFPSVAIVFMFTLALLAFFSKNIRLKISPPRPANAGDIGMDDIERSQPSAPLADSAAEENTNNNDETGFLIHSCSNPVVQVDRLCRAVPNIGPDHEYHPPGTIAEDQPLVPENTSRDNEDSTVDDATKDAAPEISSATNTPALEMSTIIQSIDSSGTSQGTDQDQSQNCLEIGAALTIKRH